MLGSQVPVQLLEASTAIRNADSAGNAALAADPNWEPLLPTPAHPEYPSGHAIYSGATERVLQEFFGDKVNVSLTNPAVKSTRTYQSLSQMGKEVVDARVWGGIHYRTSDVHGAELGRKVAEYGIQNVLRRLRNSVDVEVNVDIRCASRSLNL